MKVAMKFYVDPGNGRDLLLCSGPRDADRLASRIHGEVVKVPVSRVIPDPLRQVTYVVNTKR
jgi:hypothetical protein